MVSWKTDGIQVAVRVRRESGGDWEGKWKGDEDNSSSLFRHFLSLDSYTSTYINHLPIALPLFTVPTHPPYPATEAGLPPSQDRR